MDSFEVSYARTRTTGLGPVLTAEELCDICGATAAQRQAWAKEGDLRQRRGFDELDAAELSIYAALRAAVGPKRGKAAWRTMRPILQELLIRPTQGVWAVVDYRGIARHDVVTTPKQLAQRVANSRPVVVIDLRPVVGDARQVYRDAVARKRSTKEAEVLPMRSRR